MDAKKLSALAAALIAALCATQISESGSDADVSYGVLISEFNPFDWEGVTLTNYGEKAVDLNGWYLSDGEGKCVFSYYRLDAKSSVTVVRPDSSPKSSFADRENVIDVDSAVLKADSQYLFANGGDQVYLYDSSGFCVDALCYGSKTIDDASIWSGSSLTISGSDVYAVRNGSVDSDTASDWKITNGASAGYEFDPSLQYRATVTPFVFPDSGGVPIYEAISSAKSSVHIEMYQLTNKNMYALLCDLAEKGVEVTLLLESNPYKSDQSGVAPSLKALVNAGGEVKLIGGMSGDRFNLVHAKYAIVDGKTTIVTSENWTVDNLNGKIMNGTYSEDYGNRGWGAIIESKDYASYMEGVFSADISGKDVRDFSEMSYSNVTPASLRYSKPQSGNFKSYSASVCPILSPNNSWDSEMYWIDRAVDRIYVQQQSLDQSYEDWTESSSPLYHLNSKAISGADVRLILNSGSENDRVYVENYVESVNKGSMIDAAAMDKPYVHNKGLVCDDVAIVSSVNWTYPSFTSNREVGVAILSSDVAGYSASVFESDFDKNYAYEGLSVTITTTDKTYELGKTVTFKVSVTPAGTYTYDWDFGDGQTKTTKVPSATVTVKEGSHILKVTVSDSSGDSASASEKYVVQPSGESQNSDDGSGSGGWLKYAAIGIIILFVALIGLSRLKR